jgi:hypothetical protein
MKKIIFALFIVLLLALTSAVSEVQASTIPTISIQGVTKAETVTIQTYNFPANKLFEVRMGLLGTKGVNGILIGTVSSGAGGSMKFTLPIPTALQSENAIAIRLQSTTGGYYAYNWFYNTSFGSHTGGTLIEDSSDGASIMAVSVKEGDYVVIKGLGFPKNETLTILMDKYGTQAASGVVIKSISSGSEGEFLENIPIPESLKDEARITIRFESQDSNLAVYTWFENITGASGGSGGEVFGYTGIPTISILSVNEDDDVTIRTYNFPANKNFIVLMGKIGTKGVGGTQITTINSGDGSSTTHTFDIPAPLKGSAQIAIRLQTADNFFFAYNWFYNNTVTGSAPSEGVPSGYTGFPTFSITAVVKDNEVTIKANNFPANYDFKVLMGKMWTQGIGGIAVETINSGAGGSFSKTFTIPAGLAGEGRIAVRLESTTGGFYAYNWFYNNTYP